MSFSTAYLRCTFKPTSDAPEVSLNRLAGFFDYWFRKALPRQPLVTKVTALRRVPGSRDDEISFDLMVAFEAPGEVDATTIEDLRTLFLDAASPQQVDRLDPEKNPDLLSLRLQNVTVLTGLRTQLKVSFRTTEPALKRLPSPSDLLKVGQLQDTHNFWLWDVCFDLTTWTENCTEAAYLLTLNELANSTEERSSDATPWVETLLARLSTAEANHTWAHTAGQAMTCSGVEKVS